MKNDLIERYLYAVTKRMNPKIREDVKNELSCLIEDMLMERCGDVVPTEKDIRVVLTELGTPQELYIKYSGDGDKCLIGQPYYSTYLFVMKIVFKKYCVKSFVLWAGVPFKNGLFTTSDFSKFADFIVKFKRQ